MWEKTQPKEVHGRSQTIAPESRLEANLEGIVTGRKVYKWSETTERGYMHNFCTFLVLLLLNLLRGTEGIFMGSFLRLIKSRATNIQKKKNTRHFACRYSRAAKTEQSTKCMTVL